VPEINEFGQQVNDRPDWQGTQLLRRVALNGIFVGWNRWMRPVTRGIYSTLTRSGDDSDWTWLASSKPESLDATVRWLPAR
jgi:hypothetical protein